MEYLNKIGFHNCKFYQYYKINIFAENKDSLYYQSVVSHFRTTIHCVVVFINKQPISNTYKVIANKLAMIVTTKSINENIESIEHYLILLKTISLCYNKSNITESDITLIKCINVIKYTRNKSDIDGFLTERYHILIYEFWKLSQISGMDKKIFKDQHVIYQVTFDYILQLQVLVLTLKLKLKKKFITNKYQYTKQEIIYMLNQKNKFYNPDSSKEILINIYNLN